MLRRLTLSIFCLYLAFVGTYAVAERSPNFVLIFADDLGYGDLGCYGNTQIRTPRMDQMAVEGMKFTSFYAQPICGPSRAALMTGCYPLRVAERGNVKNVHPVLHKTEVTIAEILKAKGYATACFGKWDLAKHAQTGFHADLMPNHQGFDYFFGTPTSNDSVANLYRNDTLIEPKASMATLTKRYTDEAIGFMRKHNARPFFVYVPHTMPHTRLDASEQFKGKSKRGLYGDVIEEIDFSVGRIIDAIRELGLENNTYVLFTSDNGPWLIKNKDLADGSIPSDHGGSAGPLRSGKVSTWEGGVRVPAIVWAPGRVPERTVCDELASTLDVLPTFVALAATEIPDDRVIDGQDMRHLFAGQFDKADADKAYYYYLRTHLQAVRQGKWKLHLARPKEPAWLAPFSVNRHIAPADRVGFETPFLVDLTADIGETANVADSHPDVVQRLLLLAERAREDIGDHNRVGKHMRFFDPLDARPSSPPLPKRGRKSTAAPKNSISKQSVARPVQPVELGHVPWMRDFEVATAEAKRTDKPLLILFQEVPGCATCQNFGKGPLSHPLVVDAAREFVPACIYNSVRDKTSPDARLLARFGEPAWNNPVVRFTDSNGKDLAAKIDRDWSLSALMVGMIKALRAADRELPPWLQLVSQEYRPGGREKAVFAMGCYWSGEKAFGQFDGVLATRIGMLQRREVVEIEFDPTVVSYAALAEKAKAFRCAHTAMARDSQQAEAAGKIFGKANVVTTETPVNTSTQQKYHLFQRPEYYYLPLTELQATRANAAVASNQDPDELLSPSQTDLKTRLRQFAGTDGRAARQKFAALKPDRSPNGLVRYAAQLEALVQAIAARK